MIDGLVSFHALHADFALDTSACVIAGANLRCDRTAETALASVHWLRAFWF